MQPHAQCLHFSLHESGVIFDIPTFRFDCEGFRVVCTLTFDQKKPLFRRVSLRDLEGRRMHAMELAGVKRLPTESYHNTADARGFLVFETDTQSRRHKSCSFIHLSRKPRTTLRTVFSQCIRTTTHVKSATSAFHSGNIAKKDCRCVLAERHTTVGQYLRDNLLLINLTVRNLACNQQSGPSKGTLENT